MKKTKIIALCLAAVSMVSVFSGCSSKQEADGEKITIRLWNKPGEGDTEWKIETNDRMEKALISLGKKELEDLIAEQGTAELTCQFCDNRYLFDKPALEKLLKEAK